jgi:hypothetical protein
MDTTALMSASGPLVRRDFAGYTNKYAAPLQSSSSLEQAKKGLSIFDVSGILTDEYRDLHIQRRNRYQTYRNRYFGLHYQNPYDPDGEQKTVLNYCDSVVNWGADWLVAQGYRFNAATGNDQVAELVNAVFDKSNRDLLLWTAAQQGGMSGDVFFYVTVVKTDVSGKELPPAQHWVSVSILNPDYVIPFFDPKRPEEMSRCLIQYPMYDGNNALVLFSLEVTPEKFTSYKALRPFDS